MKSNAGLWIDHREAVIVVLSETEETTLRVQSGAAKQHAQEMPADDLRQKEFTERLARYYDAVISHLRGAGSIVIFGPGEAKGELKQRLETRKGETRAISMETADNMTDHQVAAMVRRHFHQDAPRIV
jgi:stalled ribosome rescue protein Dom34